MSLKIWQKYFGNMIMSVLLVCLGFAATVYAEDPPLYVMQFGTAGTGNGQFNLPTGIAFDSSGNILISDYDNHRIQKFSSSGGLPESVRELRQRAILSSYRYSC